jgi:hypothetical protein
LAIAGSTGLLVNELKKHWAVYCLQMLGLILLFLKAVPFQAFCQSADEPVWYVHDIIDVSLDEVKWMEQGATQEAPTWISDGSWFHASQRQSLVAKNDIFVETYESFNWTLVRQIAQTYYGTDFSNFDDFANFVSNDPSKWLDLSWHIDKEWYGVSRDMIKLKYVYDENTSDTEMWTWFHITRIPEYFAGEGKLESWLTGFDLTPVSTGSLVVWELHKEWSKSGVAYNLLFKAPANILSQHGDNFTLAIGVSSDYRGNTFKIQQVIDIDMPPNTEIRETAPSNMTVTRGNTATFVIAKGDRYPASFTVVSGPPAKSLSQTIWENASIWLFTPGGWAAIASLTVLSWTGLRGRKIWSRNKLYHRLFKSMVTVYDLYSKDLLKFHQEMDNISRSIVRLLIEDRINDEQFEKLLQRRDDLMKRAHE